MLPALKDLPLRLKKARKARSWGLGLCFIVIACAGSSTQSAATSISAERQAELGHMVRQDCGSCHGMTMKGGLGTPLLASRLAEFDDETLVYIILEGVPGTPMPPWKALITQEEAEWIVQYLREETK